MDPIRSRGHSPAPVPGHDAIELREMRTSGGASTSAAGAVVGPREAARLREIGRIADALKGASTDNHPDVRAFLDEIAVILHDEMGQSADHVEKVLDKANEYDCETSKIAEGAMGLAYGFSGTPGDLVGKLLAQSLHLQPGTHAYDFVTGLTGGMTAVAFKAVMVKFVGDSLIKGKWMQADKDALVPLIRDRMERLGTTPHQILQAALGGTGYNARNLITGPISAATQLLPENAPGRQSPGIIGGISKWSYGINQGVGLLGTVAAGAASGAIQNKLNRLHSSEYLFGRTDWKERYVMLATGEKRHSGEGGRFDEIKNNLKTPRMWLSAVRNVFTLSQLAEGAALGVGLGVANMAKTAGGNSAAESMAKKAGSLVEAMQDPAKRARREINAQMAYYVPAATGYFAQGAAGVAYSHAKPPVKEWAGNAYDQIKQTVRERLGITEASSSSSSSTDTDTSDEAAPVSSGARTPSGEPPAPASESESEAPSVGIRTEASSSSSSSTDTDTSDEAAPVSSGARTPSGEPPAPASESSSESEAPSVGIRRDDPPETTEGRARSDTSSEGEFADARSRLSSASDQTFRTARTHISSDEPDIRARTETLSLRPGSRGAADDIPVRLSDFTGASDIESPAPERSASEHEAVLARIEAEAERMSVHIDEEIPLPDILPPSGAEDPAGSSRPTEAAEVAATAEAKKTS